MSSKGIHWLECWVILSKNKLYLTKPRDGEDESPEVLEYIPLHEIEHLYCEKTEVDPHDEKTASNAKDNAKKQSKGHKQFNGREACACLPKLTTVTVTGCA